MSISEELKLRINGAINAPKVRLIDENNTQVGIVSIDEALSRAAEVGLDLVEVSPTSDPPVCRIMDYGKWLYQQKRKQRDASKKQHRHAGELKEIRFQPSTDKHDLDIKLRHAREFLQKGYKVQLTLVFKGRQMLHTDLGYTAIEQAVQALADVGQVDRPASLSGRRMVVVLAPR
ncbi:MAG: translation initiation factor IF-3 [Sedimentisphaerales bacterium]|nr:translation initiation factor IF-3 [Sedimentisphaerales bacterium]